MVGDIASTCQCYDVNDLFQNGGWGPTCGTPFSDRPKYITETYRNSWCQTTYVPSGKRLQKTDGKDPPC